MKQYTTSIPITAGGSTFPKYSTALGIFLPSGKRINGIARVARVVTATSRIIATERQNETGRLLTLFNPLGFNLLFLNSVIREKYNHNYNHRRQYKAVFTKNKKTDKTCYNSDYCRETIFLFKPLFNKNHNKQCRHSKINSR